MPTSSDSVLKVSGHATGPDKDILISDSRACAKKNENNESGTKMFRFRHECEKSLVTNCSLSAVSTAKWLSYYRIERRSTMSCHHGSKISGSEQSFLTETAICIVERSWKSMGYNLLVSAIMPRKVTNVNSLLFYHCWTTVCCTFTVLVQLLT